MTIIKTHLLTFFSLVGCLLLSACSSTQTDYSDNKSIMNNGYYANNMTSNNTTGFYLTRKSVQKKALVSDHHIMISLLNRSVTADQAMMQQFEANREQYANSYFMPQVTIKGEKSTDKNQSRAQHAYANFIEQDINSVRISAMPE